MELCMCRYSSMDYAPEPTGSDDMVADAYCCETCNKPVECDICDNLVTVRHCDYFVCSEHFWTAVDNVASRRW